MNELQKVLEQLEDIYKDSSVQNTKLAKTITYIHKELIALTDPAEYLLPGISNDSFAELIDDDVLKITVNKLPGRVSLYKTVGTQYYKNQMDYWKGVIKYAVTKANLKVYYKQCVVLIAFYYKDKIWDADNQFVSFIINALKECQLFNDDDYKTVQYMMLGKTAKDDFYFTELYIVNQNKFANFYNKFKDE